eukprot:2191361-Pyramimonas_sp.AAC.1
MVTWLPSGLGVVVDGNEEINGDYSRFTCRGRPFGLDAPYQRRYGFVTWYVIRYVYINTSGVRQPPTQHILSANVPVRLAKGVALLTVLAWPVHLFSVDLEEERPEAAGADDLAADAAAHPPLRKRKRRPRAPDPSTSAQPARAGDPSIRPTDVSHDPIRQQRQAEADQRHAEAKSVHCHTRTHTNTHTRTHTHEHTRAHTHVLLPETRCMLSGWRCMRQPSPVPPHIVVQVVRAHAEFLGTMGQCFTANGPAPPPPLASRAPPPEELDLVALAQVAAVVRPKLEWLRPEEEEEGEEESGLGTSGVNLFNRVLENVQEGERQAAAAGAHFLFPGEGMGRGSERNLKWGTHEVSCSGHDRNLIQQSVSF